MNDDQKPFRAKREAGNRSSRSEVERPDWQTRVAVAPDPLKAKSPVIPDAITANDLPLQVRVQLKTLTEENAERVARHLAMVGLLIDQDPELAHAHAMAAVARAARIGLVHEFAGSTAYAIGDYALAIRELLTHRRISGSNEQIALIVDSERGMGRPDKALEAGRAVDRTKISAEARVNLAIAMSGARLDRNEPDLALAELEIAELNPGKVFEYSVPLFIAYAECLRELKRDAKAKKWDDLAIRAERQFEMNDKPDEEKFEVIEEIEIPKLSERPKTDRNEGGENKERGSRPSLDEVRKSRNTFGGAGHQGGNKFGNTNNSSRENKGGGRGKFGGSRGR
jgi:tetratricopeptide (TPR) repeat protein